MTSWPTYHRERAYRAASREKNETRAARLIVKALRVLAPNLARAVEAETDPDYIRWSDRPWTR
jgi:hypothetical protein